MSENTTLQTETEPETVAENKTETEPETANKGKKAERSKGKKAERVEVFIPRGNANDDPNLFVSINGVNYLLPKGKTSMVPPHVKAEIERSNKAQIAQDENIDALKAASEK